VSRARELVGVLAKKRGRQHQRSLRTHRSRSTTFASRQSSGEPKTLDYKDASLPLAQLPALPYGRVITSR
jgi:hypothetical protein